MKIHQYPSDAAEKRLQSIARRNLGARRKEMAVVKRVLENVRKNGDSALVDYARQFDAPGFQLAQLKVSRSEMVEAGRHVDAGFKRALTRAADQIAAFHRQQKPRSWVDASRAGTLLGQMVRPVDAAGIYVPGGRGGQTPLVSSVLMGAIPAKIAGVPRIVMATPPTREGALNPYLLAAALKAGVDEVYRIGSAWAIAALAYGTQSVTKVDVVVGPGNIFVSLAKKMVSGLVKIDMIAGPSEILVIADDGADAGCVAADMLSQAEHDPLASAILVTDSTSLARAVRSALQQQVVQLARREIAEQSLKAFSAIIVVRDIAAAIDLANRIAPEHLELQVRNAMDYLGQIRHAGAVFIGPFSPEPVGDYVAGPNHVLPTAGTARFSSALSVDHFLKKTSLIRYSAGAFQAEAKDIIRLADVEGLDAHARAVKLRLDRLKSG